MEIALQPITGFQDDTRPSALKSVSYHDYICTAMDHIVIITEKYTIQTRLDLECLVDDLVVAENILVIGDELGTIHFVQLKSGRILFSKVVTEPPCKFTNIILTRLGDCYELLVVLSDGHMIRLTGIPVHDIATITEPNEFLEMLSSSISMTMIDSQLRDISNVTRFEKGKHPFPRYLVHSFGDTPLSIWTELGSEGFIMVDSIDYYMFASAVTQTMIVPDSNILVVLDSESNLYLLDINTFVLFKQKYVKGLVDISTTSTPAKKGCILGLFNDGGYVIRQIHIPSFEFILAIESVPKTKFIKGPLDGPDRVIGSQNSEFAIEIFEFVNSSPVQVLTNFAKQKDLNGALQYTKKHGCSISVYYKAFLEHHQDLGLDEIGDAFEKANSEFVATFATNYNSLDLNRVSAVLNMARKAVQVQFDETTCNLIASAIVRLRTFELLKERDELDHWDGDWQTFRTSNMLLNIQTAIGNQDVTLALTLWRRHCQDDQLNQHMKDLLYNIPPQLQLETILLILDEFRYSLSTLASLEQTEMQRMIDEWVYQTSEAIEQLYNDPENALRLLKWCMASVMGHEKSLISPNFQIGFWNEISQLRVYQNSEQFEKIKKRIAVLEDILELKEKHKFCITLSDYEKSTIQLLERVHAPELLAMNIANHVEPFVKKHDLLLCNVLSDYCKEVMENSNRSGGVVNHWENRVLIIMDLVLDTTFKSTILLEAMRRTLVPWSEELEQRIQNTLMGSNPTLLDEIQEQHKLMKLKLMVQKYGIKSFNVSDTNLALKLIPFILKHVEFTDAIADAMQCLNAYHSGSKYEIIVIRCQHLIEHNEMKRLESLLQNGKETDDQTTDYMEDVDKESVLKELDTWISLKLERLYQKNKPTTCLVQYLKAGVITLTLLSAIDPNRFQKNQRYERCVVLSHDLNIRITPSHLDDNDFVDATLDGILKEAILDQTREKMNFAYRVGDLLGYDRPQLLWKTAQTLAMQFRYAETLSTCRELSEKFSNEQTAKLISELIELLLDQEPSIYLQLKNLSGVTSSIVEMARIAVRKSQPRDLEYHLDLFKKVELMHQIISKTDKGAYQKALESNGENPDSKFTAIFKTQHKEIGLVISSEKAVPLILAFLKDLKKVEKQVKGKGKGKDDSGDFVESGMDLVQLCHSTRNYQCCSRSIQLLLEKCVLKRVRVPEKLEETFNDALLYLLQNILSVPHIDFNYALGTILSLPKDKANIAFKNSVTAAGQDYEKLYRIAKVGAMAGSVWNQRTFQVNCMMLAQHARWLQELTLLDIPFDETLLKNTTDTRHQRTLIPYLLVKSGGDLELTLSFAEQYHIESDFVYSQFVLQELVVHSITERDISLRFARLEDAINAIANKELFVNFLLKQCHAKLSPYDYEALLFVNQEILKLCPDMTPAKKNVLVLEILLNYTRTSPPSPEESSNNTDPDHDIGLGNIEKTWVTSWSKNNHLRMKRLPFHSVILDPFAVLSLELNDSTLPRLLPVGKVLDIPSDKFYEHVIQRKVTLLQNQIKTKSQSLSKLGYISFNDFRPLLTKIKDFQQAISLSVFVGGNFPRGEDRIAAYRISLSFSQKWIASLATDTSSMIEKAQTGAAKVKGLLNVAETEHVLQTHGLQIFDKYVPKPSMLLMKLLTLNPSNPPLSADIYHSIASEIAERSSIDIEKVKLMLLQRWLSDNDGEVSDVQIQERVLFLLHQKLEWGISNLKAFAKQPTNKVRTESRIRALAILYRISKMPEKLLDSAVIEKQLRLHLYLHDLERIQMVQTPKEFDACDKHALARSIWVTKRNDLIGLRLICKLAIDFGLHDHQLWNNVLSALYQKQDFEYLLELLLRLSNLAQYSALDSIPELFQPVVLECCKKWLSDNVSLNMAQVPYFLEYVQIGSTSCHVNQEFGDQLYALLSEWIFKDSFEPNRYNIAFYCMSRVAMTCSFEDVHVKMNAKDHLAVLESLQKSEIVALSEVKTKIQNSVFDLIDAKKWYSDIAVTKFMASFVKYLAQNHKIHQLVNASVEMERYEDALKLIQVYFNIHDPADLLEKDLILKFHELYAINQVEDFLAFFE